MEKALTTKIRSLGYSSYEIKVMIYALKTILYEASKFVILALFFAWLQKFSEFLSAFVCLMAVRSRSGGIHLKHYWSCFLITFLAFFSAVLLLPLFLHPTRLFMTAVLILCMITAYRTGPIPSVSRPKPDNIRLRSFRQQTAVIIGIFAVLVLLIGENPYIESGFFMILFQSAQLLIAKRIQGGDTL